MIRFERRLGHPVERVWRALTEPDEIAAWLALAELELVARGTVSRLDPPGLLEFDTDIHGRLRWELRPDGDGTALVFTAEARLPEDYEVEVLDGGTIDWPDWGGDHLPGWERIRERYSLNTRPGP